MSKNSSREDSAASAGAVWLTIIGINEDGIDGLSSQACEALSAATVVFGGQRHLALAAPLIRGAREVWRSPIDASIQHIRELAGQPIVVLASGDPFLFGVGSLLGRVIPMAEMKVFPAPSSVSLGCARLGWSQQQVALLSVCGRPVQQLERVLKHGARIMVLSEGAESPRQIAQYLSERGFGSSRMHVLEALGGADERVRCYASLADFTDDDVHPLNLVALELVDQAADRCVSLASGRPSDGFLHDGQISRDEIRAIVQARLAPEPGDWLWDIGAGSGAVALEWLLLDDSLRAVAVERNAERCQRIEANARRYGVENRLRVIHASAPAAITSIAPPPNAVFVGGGACVETIECAAGKLAPGGRLVANSVTLESDALLMECYRQYGGMLSRFSIEHCAPLGSLSGWQAARSIMQWCWHKSATQPKQPV